jgi:electron transfer flavoprotein beta subunit
VKYIVCAKLTPDTEQLADVRPEDVASGKLGVTMVLNPWDEFAVEEALQLQDRYGGETVAISLGSEESTEALKRAIAMGVQTPILLSDEQFCGSDAWGTAYVLAQAIRNQQGTTLILTGRQSIDGNSGLVAAGVAAWLGLPFISSVSKILEVTETSAVVQRTLDEGVQTVRVPCPAVLSLSKEINEPRFPSFMGIRKASKLQYPVTTKADLPGLDCNQFGRQAAYTEWRDLRKPPKRTATCEFIGGTNAAEQAGALVDKLIADKVL